MTAFRSYLVTTMSQRDDDAGACDRTQSENAAGWRHICPHCGGTGLIERVPCPNCAGTGRTEESGDGPSEAGD